jgi:methionyl-tRNA formyltransferase
MRVVYFGSGAFSVPCLQAVLSSGHEVVGTFTQPAKPAGRGGQVQPTPVAQAARGAGRQVVECPDINADEVVGQIRAQKADVICVVDFGQMIRDAVLEAVPLGAFNLHGSLLPELRGAAPIQWAIIRGYARTGVTSFRIVRGMDAGPIYLQAELDIGADETAEDLKPRLAALGAQTVCGTLALLAGGGAGQARQQDHSKATPAPRLKKEDGIVNWSAPAESIRNLVRGTWPWPGAQATLRRADGRLVPVAIARARLAEGPSRGEAGVLDDQLAVATGGGRLEVVRLRPAGKRIMEWRDFVNGYRLTPGDSFVAPEGLGSCP